MIVITKENVAQCNEIILKGNQLIAFVENCTGCSFVALDAPDEIYALSTFEYIQKKIAEGKTVIDLTDEEVYSPINSKIEPIEPVSVFEAVKIARRKEPFGLFITSETVENETIFIGIDNSTGRGYVEDFNTKDECERWLRGEFEKE